MDNPIKINLSTTFPKRCLCKFCKQGPAIAYLVRNPTFFKNPRFILEKFEYIRSNVKRMCKDTYLYSSPSKVKNIGEFAFQIQFKGYNPKAHRARGTTNKNNLNEYVICDCGMTVWAFNYKSNENKKEFTQRRARNDHDGIIF